MKKKRKKEEDKCKYSKQKDVHRLNTRLIKFDLNINRYVLFGSVVNFIRTSHKCLIKYHELVFICQICTFNSQARV